MHAVTFQAPGEVRVDERPDPELQAPDDAIVRIEATGVCGSDLHIYPRPCRDRARVHHRPRVRWHGIAAGDAVSSVAVGDRVLGCFQVACAICRALPRGNFHKCERSRTFGHGAASATCRARRPSRRSSPTPTSPCAASRTGCPSDVALFAGDVMGTGFHAALPVRPGDNVAVLGLGPVGLCAVQAARAEGAAQVIAIDGVPARLDMARSFGAAPVHLTEEDPRAAVKAATDGRGVDVAIDAVGDPRALDLAIRVAANCATVSVVGVYAERAEVHMGLVWIKALTLHTGQANVIGHLDRVLALMSAGVLDPGPLVTHHMSLADAPAAYELYDRREALKIVLEP